MVPEIFTTEDDVALDVLAALDYFGGLVGGEATTIDELQISPDDRATILLTLSNGDKYELRVRESL